MKIIRLTEKKDKILIAGKNEKLSNFTQLDKVAAVFTFDLATEFDGSKDNSSVFYFHRISQSKEVWDKICEKSKKWLEEWHHTKILQDKSILDIFKFEDISLWWFIFDQVWTEKNGVFDTLYYFETLSWILKKYKPKKVELVGEFDYPLELLLRQMSKKFGIEIIQNIRFNKKPVTVSKNKLRNKISYLIKLVVLKQLFYNNLTKCSLLIISNNSKFIKKENKIVAKCEVYLNGLESLFEKNSKKIKFVTNDNSFANQNTIKFFQTIRNLKKNGQGTWISNYSVKTILLQKRFLNKVTKKILEIEKNSKFSDSWTWNEVNVYPLIQEIFLKKIPKLLFLSKLELMTSVLKNDAPKTLLLTEGLSIRSRALSYLSDKIGIDVVVPQVGIYIRNPIPTGLLIHKSFDTRVLPKYLVWGEFYETFYKKCGFPDSKVHNIGFFRNTQSSKYNHKKKYVLYIAGANLNRFNYIHTFEEEIFTIKKIQENLPPDLDLIVKLHPGHPIELYKKNLSELKETKIVTKEDEVDVLSLIESAEITLGKYSTVLVEAIMASKPVVIVNFASEINFLGIEEIPFIMDPKELEGIFQSVLKKQFRVNNEARNQFYPVGDESISLMKNEIIQIFKKTE